MPEFDSSKPITVSAEAGNRWQEGVYEVWVLQGSCLIQQGNSYAKCREAVLWINRGDVTALRPNKVIAYLEGDVEVATDPSPGATRMKDQTWLGRFESIPGVQVSPVKAAGKPDVNPPIYARGMAQRNPQGDGPIFAAQKKEQSPEWIAADSHSPSPVRQAQFTGPTPIPAPAPLAAEPPSTAPFSMRRLSVYSRSNERMQA